MIDLFSYSTGSVDYEPLVDQSLVIAFNEPIGASVCLDVTITGDNFVEGNETFVVTFTPHPTLNPEDIITGQSQVTVTIVDNPEDGMHPLHHDYFHATLVRLIWVSIYYL